MRSVSAAPLRRVLRTATLTLVAAGPLAGCTTTQHEARRMQLNSARERAAVTATRVREAGRSVTVTHVATVSAGGKTAFVVTIRTRARRAVTDLPISIGYTRAGKPRRYLNAAGGIGYFEAHLPAIFPGHSRIWVYTADRPLPPGAHPFVLIGSKSTVRAVLTETDVKITVAVGSSNGVSAPRITLRNPSSVPQYQLQVYAYARRGRRVVAAGDATVADLGAGSTQRLTLPLVGDARGAQLELDVAPTILQ